MGDRTNLVELWDAIASAAGTDVQPTFGPPRAGDIPHSLASIEKAKKLFGYDPQFRLRDGFKIVTLFRVAYNFIQLDLAQIN